MLSRNPNCVVKASFQPSEKGCLTFIHIPKTGGTSIETALVRASHETRASPVLDGRRWGHDDKGLWKCTSFHPGVWPRCDVPPAKRARCSAWHVPLSSDDKLVEVYEKCDTFCVVRHPVDRLVSQYQFESNGCNQTKFDVWLNRTVREFGKDPYIRDCHMVPQIDYVSVFHARRKAFVRSCDHILRFEQLDEDFSELMEAYNLTIALDSRRKARGHEDCNLTLSEQQLFQVRAMYNADFFEFGFS